MTRSMLKTKKLPKQFWGEAVSTSAYILNRCPSSRLEGITPEEAWSGKKPNINHLRIFGSLCYKHVPDAQRKKLDDKSERLILIGYHTTGAYRLYNPYTQRIVLSRDVKVDETQCWDWESPTENQKKNVSIQIVDQPEQ
ncbi:hypothetical protein TanjilG_10768 [Lupinus angustifolius]|uniref:Retroviral polymerase SH3-like domain-containing protein n=1 Tax=Lupinus angustifolius TaxID=3871 RepID=A0A1J7HR96_LUPAN|nr:hypothetical protein TanjilG_10768 [Lupinus angustifolius]